MRWNEIINESIEWDLAGFWITETGERIEVDHDKGVHHANIALDHFIDYLDFSDFSEPIDPYNDEFITDMAIEAAFDSGWVRVSTSPREINVTYWKLNRNSLISLKKHIANEQPVPSYRIEKYTGDVDIFVDKVGDLKEYFRKLNKIYHSKK